jgi:ribonuclease E
MTGVPAASTNAPEPHVSSSPEGSADSPDPTAARSGPKKRRRGSRGGRGRSGGGGAAAGDRSLGSTARSDEDNSEVDERAAAPKPKIGDTRPAFGTSPPPPGPRRNTEPVEAASDGGAARKKRRRGGRGTGAGAGAGGNGGSGRNDGRRNGAGDAIRAGFGADDDLGDPIELDEATLERRRGKERNGRPLGRYLMTVHVRPHATQIGVLEGRSLIEHYVSRPTDDATQIDGNIYLAKVQNVLPGMEAAFVDIGTPKNAVLYRGDVRYDAEDVESSPAGDGGNRSGSKAKQQNLKIEQMLRPGQTIMCQVTKNPIGTKGARLTQEVSLPGRFVVLIPNSDTYGISKRLSDDERKRLRRILDAVKPAEHGVIVRTAAEGTTEDELRRDVLRLLKQWEQIEALANRSKAATLLYKEPDLAVRVIREEFNKEYRGVVIDDQALYEEVRDYVASITPELADRVELYDAEADGLPIFERFHVHEQLHKALDRKVWLPSGGSLIIERTEALTVIDVNTGKNVGTTNLEETVFRNNLEAAAEVARQLRLRDVGGIIVIDFIDMEIRDNRTEVMRAFREALARDKTRTQVFDISELGLVEMTRKRVSEGLVESFSTTCTVCNGRGLVFDESLL